MNEDNSYQVRASDYSPAGAFWLKVLIVWVFLILLGTFTVLFGVPLALLASYFVGNSENAAHVAKYVVSISSLLIGLIIASYCCNMMWPRHSKGDKPQ